MKKYLIKCLEMVPICLFVAIVLYLLLLFFPIDNILVYYATENNSVVTMSANDLYSTIVDFYGNIFTTIGILFAFTGFIAFLNLRYFLKDFIKEQMKDNIEENLKENPEIISDIILKNEKFSKGVEAIVVGKMEDVEGKIKKNKATE